ncbi:hypothetical protein [Psychroflexus aestuariivivens]|uniref:hypothetical protein n=1 Tax=Psychroflexus aestuariivivens TaxID=1795040 RepID=UPI000FDB83E0|nr:hypothetical protein [Psychroflexus aestuariivivens]
MTYEEAEAKLLSMGDSQLEDGVLFINRISPEIKEDHLKFQNDLKIKSISNEEMKKYSSNNEFDVRSYRAPFFPNA